MGVMNRFLFFLSAAWTLVGVESNDDLFNYRSTSGNDYGPTDWRQVSCDSGVGKCVSDSFAAFVMLYRPAA